MFRITRNDPTTAQKDMYASESLEDSMFEKLQFVKLSDSDYPGLTVQFLEGIDKEGKEFIIRGMDMVRHSFIGDQKYMLDSDYIRFITFKNADFGFYSTNDIYLVEVFYIGKDNISGISEIFENYQGYFTTIENWIKKLEQNSRHINTQIGGHDISFDAKFVFKPFGEFLCNPFLDMTFTVDGLEQKSIAFLNMNISSAFWYRTRDKQTVILDSESVIFGSEDYISTIQERFINICKIAYSEDSSIEMELEAMNITSEVRLLGNKHKNQNEDLADRINQLYTINRREDVSGDVLDYSSQFITMDTVDVRKYKPMFILL